MNNHQHHARRRTELIKLMGSGIAVIPTSDEKIRNGDAHYTYRYDSYFHYLSGFEEPEAVLVLLAGSKPRAILFCRERNIEREIWEGYRYGPEAAKLAFGFDQCYPISQLNEMLVELMSNQQTLFHPLGADSTWDVRMLEVRKQVQAKVRSGISAPNEIRDVRVILDEMRLIKDETELDSLRQAAQISSEAHISAMQVCSPGMFEYEIEASLLYKFRKHGAQAPAYPSIVAGGANACVLHYVTNNDPLKAGDLLLIDAACEFNGYAADISRTFPVNGKFSEAQKDVYQIVLAAQAAAIEVCRPGFNWNDPHLAALRVISQGLIDLKLCTGSVDDVIESESYKTFYMHRTGHWLGMDVHDVGAYKIANEWRILQSGMVFTVEPGCYIRPSDDVPEALWNIGIRIEDNIAINETGCEVLTAAAPKSVEAIEEMMRNKI